MYILGIDESDGWVLEGSSTYGARIVLPLPLLTPARFVSAPLLESRFVSGIINGTEYVFREDAFDPVTRLRRGRFYKKRIGIDQPEEWKVYMNPTYGTAGLHGKRAVSYAPVVASELSDKDNLQLLVVLGAGEAFNIWTVINKETVHTNELLVTLKARQSFGVLPEIDWNRVPKDAELLREKIESLRDDVYRAGAESVVDRAREAATAILSAYLQDKGVPEASGKDLGALTDLLDKRSGINGQRIVRCAAEIPQRLHSRGKHAEQEKRDNLRPIREQDAELAVQCIGVMLCDLGWANWS